MNSLDEHTTAINKIAGESVDRLAAVSDGIFGAASQPVGQVELKCQKYELGRNECCHAYAWARDHSGEQNLAERPEQPSADCPGDVLRGRIGG